MNFCPNCSCHNCTAIKKVAQRKVDAREARKEAKRERIDENRRKRDELLLQASLIWMLVNTTKNSSEAYELMNQIAIALDVSPGVVNARRLRFVSVMCHRIAGERISFGKIPGTVGSELPDHCVKCGGMKTEGKPCARRSCR